MDVDQSPTAKSHGVEANSADQQPRTALHQVSESSVTLQSVPDSTECHQRVTEMPARCPAAAAAAAAKLQRKCPTNNERTVSTVY